MRDYILLYINGQRKVITGQDAFLSLSDYLRYEERLTGTKVVCAEGDCGACTLMVGRPSFPKNGTGNDEKISYKFINSCISFVYLMDCCHIVTIEGVKEKNGTLHPVQQAMVENHGSQCGFCTPGFVMSTLGLLETHIEEGKAHDWISEKKVKNYLTGNLCRCTGYLGIIQGVLSVNPEKVVTLRERYHSPEMVKDLQEHLSRPLHLETATKDKKIFAPIEAKQAVTFKASHPETRLFASATDLGVQINKGRPFPRNILSLALIEDLHDCQFLQGTLIIGARVTLHQLQKFAEDKIPELSRFLNIFASPQIKNNATLAGNIANGSPIGDTLPFLMVTEARLELLGPSGTRMVPLTEFYLGYKKLNLKNDEIITRIHIPLPEASTLLRLYKVSKRKDLDISGINAAFLMKMKTKNESIESIRISYGGVGPTVLRFRQVEDFLRGRTVSPENFREAAEKVSREITPLSDVRGSSAYRTNLAKNLFWKFFLDLRGNGNQENQENQEATYE